MRPLGDDHTICSGEFDVLVVDDEQDINDLIARCLKNAGYRCAQVARADEAWSILKKGETPLLTLDINLPGRSGLELLLDVKAAGLDTEVVMLTALGETQAAIAALTRGASAYLIKPVAYEELLFHVRKALERRELLVDKRRYTENLEVQVREQIKSIRCAHEETIHRLLTAAMIRDEETGAHIRRTGLYSELFAEMLGWPIQEIDTIRLAAPMHDVGKIGIPDAILRKPGKLSDAEFEIMKTHTVIGARILSGSDWPVLKLAQQIALHHHERWDGTGYLHGLSGDEIPLAARILAIVDVYDALTHDRVYRPALSEDEAVEIMTKGRGTHFDPFLFGIFLSALPELRRISSENPDSLGDDWSTRVDDVMCKPGDYEMFASSPSAMDQTSLIP